MSNKVEEFKKILRGVVREELDFYFEKISKKLDEIKVSNISGGVLYEQEDRNKKPIKKERKPSKPIPDFRGKFKNLLEETAVEMSGDDLDEEGDVEISDGKLEKILDENPALNAVNNALKRDYSGLIKTIENKAYK